MNRKMYNVRMAAAGNWHGKKEGRKKEKREGMVDIYSALTNCLKQNCKNK
jgi:hypothetical protein